MSGKNPLMFMMIGLSGSGKSTVLNKLNAKVVVSSDWHLQRIADERKVSYNEVFRDAITIAISEMSKDVEFCTERGISFIWDQTNLDAASRKKKLESVPAHYTKIAVMVDTDLDTAIARNSQRARVIPENVIRNMNNKLTKPLISEGFDHIMTFDTSGNVVRYEDKDGVHD
jgi:predicted kinase